MKNLSLLFIAFLLLQLNTLAQEGWFWQNPSPQGNHLEAVDFVDELPKNNYGKISKRELKAKYWQGKERKI